MEIGGVQETEFGEDRGEYRRLGLMKIVGSTGDWVW